MNGDDVGALEEPGDGVEGNMDEIRFHLAEEPREGDVVAPEAVRFVVREGAEIGGQAGQFRHVFGPGDQPKLEFRIDFRHRAD